MSGTPAYPPAARAPARVAASVDESVRRVFVSFDRDGSGDLDVRELTKALKALGLETDHDATRGVMSKYDLDGGGKLDLAEFARLAEEVKKFQRSGNLTTSGTPAHPPAARVGALPPYVPAAPARVAASVDESVRRVFASFDRDGSGDLDVRELTKALKALGLETDRDATRGVMSKYDLDGGGKLDLAEFARLAEEVKKFQRSGNLPAAAPSSGATKGGALSAAPTIKIEEALATSDVSTLASRYKEDLDRLFSFYAKLQGSGVSTGAPPTLELDEAFHLLDNFGVLATIIKASSAAKHAPPAAAVTLPRDAARTAFQQAATGKLTPNEKSDALGRKAFFEFLVRLALSPAAAATAPSSAASSLFGADAVAPGKRVHALLGCFCVGEGAERMRSYFTNLRGEPVKIKPSSGGGHRAPAVSLDADTLPEGRHASSHHTITRKEASGLRANIGARARAPPLILTVHEVTLTPEAASRVVGPLSVSATLGSSALSLPPASAPPAQLDARRRAADFGWEQRWALQEEEARAVVRQNYLRYKGAVAPSVRKAFELFDKDNSGDIDTRELRPALRQLGLEGVDMGATREAMAKYDADGGGKLDMAEFSHLVQDIRSFQEPSYLPTRAPRPSLPLSLSVSEAHGKARSLGVASLNLADEEADVDYAEALLFDPSAKDAKSKQPIGRVLYSANAASALAPYRLVREAFVAADADGSGHLSLEAAAAALEHMGVRPTSAAAVARVYADANGKPAEGALPVDMATFDSVCAALLAEAAAKLAERKRGGPAEASGGEEEALAEGVETVLAEKRMAMRLVPGRVYTFWLGAHECLELVEVQNTNARLVVSARDASDVPRVSAATLFDGAVYFHQKPGAPVRGGPAWTMPGPFCYELSVSRPQQLPDLSPVEAQATAEAPMRVLLRTLSRFERAEVLRPDTEHALLAAALPKGVVFTRNAHAAEAQMQQQYAPQYGTAAPGHAATAYGAEAQAPRLGYPPQTYPPQTYPQTYGQPPAPHYAQALLPPYASPYARPHAATPAIQVATHPAGAPPPRLAAGQPPPPSASEVDAAQRQLRQRADATRRAFEHFDAERSGRVQPKALVRALQTLGVPIKPSLLSAVGQAGAGEGLDATQFGELVAKLQASGAVSALGDAAEVLEAKAVFDRFDRDRSGAISTRELRQALNALELKTDSAQAVQILRQFDADGSGSLDMREFTGLLSKLREHLSSSRDAGGPPDGALVASFRSFDHGEGSLGIANLRAALLRAGVDTSSRPASELIADLSARDVAVLDMAAFRRIAHAIHAHSGGAASAEPEPPVARYDLAPGASPYYTPHVAAPAPTAYAAYYHGASVHGASVHEPPPTAYEAYLMAAGAAGHRAPHQPASPYAASPYGAPPPGCADYGASGALPHASQAARAALTTAEVRAQQARARTTATSDARRAARKPTTPSRAVVQPAHKAPSRASAYESAYELPATPLRY